MATRQPAMAIGWPNEDVISTDHLDELVACISCSVTDKACMYSECLSCKNKQFPFEQHDCNAETMWTQWKTVAEERNINWWIK